MQFRTTLMFLALAGASLAQAQEERAYDARISLGYVATSGNTDTTTFNSEFLLTWRTDMWTHNVKFQGLGSQENSVTRAERYYLEDKSDFNLDDDHYLYAKGTYTDDRFSGFDYQASVSAGYGRHLLRTDRFEVQGFAGAGYRENNLIEGGGAEGESIFTLGQDLKWQISDNARLVQSLNSEIGEELSVSRFEVGLESNIIDRLATKLSFQARHTSEVPVDTKKTDTLTSVSLVYSF